MRCRLGLFSDILLNRSSSPPKRKSRAKTKKEKKKNLGVFPFINYLKHNLMRGKKTGHPLNIFVHRYSSIDILAFFLKKKINFKSLRMN